MGALDIYMSFALERFLMHYNALEYVCALCISQLTSCQNQEK